MRNASSESGPKRGSADVECHHGATRNDAAYGGPPGRRAVGKLSRQRSAGSSLLGRSAATRFARPAPYASSASRQAFVARAPGSASAAERALTLGVSRSPAPQDRTLWRPLLRRPHLPSSAATARAVLRRAPSPGTSQWRRWAARSRPEEKTRYHWGEHRTAASHSHREPGAGSAHMRWKGLGEDRIHADDGGVGAETRCSADQRQLLQIRCGSPEQDYHHGGQQHHGDCELLDTESLREQPQQRRRRSRHRRWSIPARPRPWLAQSPCRLRSWAPTSR